MKKLDKVYRTRDGIANFFDRQISEIRDCYDFSYLNAMDESE